MARSTKPRPVIKQPRSSPACRSFSERWSQIAPSRWGQFSLTQSARGLGTCVQMLIAGFPDVVHQALQIPDRYEILCGLAIGYAVEDFPANNLDVPRKSIDATAVFLDQ